MTFKIPWAVFRIPKPRVPDCNKKKFPRFQIPPSSETQRQSVEPGEKARRKFSRTGGRAPGYRLSPDHFQTVKWMLAPDWAQKMLCIIVPNRRTVSPEFFSWVRTRRLLSRHSCPVRSPSFPNQKRRNYRWVEKRFGCYQQEQFILHWENSVSDGSQCIVNDRKFKMRRRRDSKNAIAWQGKTTTLHVHRAFCTFLCRHCTTIAWKCLISGFCEGRKQTMAKFSFSLWTWIWLIENQLQNSLLAFDKVSELG